MKSAHICDGHVVGDEEIHAYLASDVLWRELLRRNVEDDRAEPVPSGIHAMRVLDLSERKDGLDRHPNLALCKPAQELRQIWSEIFGAPGQTEERRPLLRITPNLDEQAGYLHLLKNGRLTISHPHARPIDVDTPSIIFLPRPHAHRLHASQEAATELVCATVEFGTGMLNPLTASFPEPFIIPLDALPELAPTLQLLFSESSSGLSDPRLSKAIELMHKHPGTSWSLEQLAQHAGMSRARFAAHFRKVVGVTSFNYLTDWRLGIAQTMLRKGNLLKLTAAAIGYTNATALTRVFTLRLGASPTEWLRSQRASLHP